METSDSEYFESADEDFNSDSEETEKIAKRTCQNSSQQHVTTLELPKQNIVESQHNTTQKEIDCNLKTVESQPADLIHVKSIVKTPVGKISQNDLSKVEGEIMEKLTFINVSEDILINSSKPKGHQLNDSNQSNQNIIPSNASKTHNIDKAADQTESVIKPEKEEDNLWNDDEIDWGLEAAKEESEKTNNHTAVSKNEDSGWDDFDAEWESETPSSNISKNELTETKSTKINNGETDHQSGKDNQWEVEDEWEPLEKPRENESSWGSWGGWGVSSLLNTATQSVSSLTNHVSHGLSTVLETGIGIPEPEEMARINTLQVENKNIEVSMEKPNNSDSSLNTPSGFGLGNLVSGVSQLTKFVESTGTKVITGGLDTLEAIGKKTVEVLQEGDPGLKKKRAFLKLDTGKPNLSQILREAKERAEEENRELAEKRIESKKVKNYEAVFDDYQGLVHLEALEMLSKLCNIKLNNLSNSLLGETLKDMQETLEQVKELCELPEEEDDDKAPLEDAKETISSAVNEINIPISYDKLFAVCIETDDWLLNVNLNFIDDDELHQQAIDTLAQLTAFAVEQFHKAGELLLVKEHRSTADEADSLVQITATIKSVILCEAGKFTNKLNSIENANKDKITEHITNIFYEASNSCTYIHDAFQLLIPVLQVGAV